MTVKKIVRIVALLTAPGMVAAAEASIKYVQSDGSRFNEVTSSEVQRACGKNFVYRDVGKGQVAPYLHQEIVKASLTEQTVDDLPSLRRRLKSSAGTCSWITDEEFGKL